MYEKERKLEFPTVNAKFRQKKKTHDFKIKGASKHTFLGMKRELIFYIGLMAIFKWFVICDPYLNQSSKALFFFFFENTEEKRKEKKKKTKNKKQNHSSQSLQTDRQSANLFLRSRYWWTTHTFPFISLFPPSFPFLFSSSSFELILNKSDYSIPCV